MTVPPFKQDIDRLHGVIASILDNHPRHHWTGFIDRGAGRTYANLMIFTQMLMHDDYQTGIIYVNDTINIQFLIRELCKVASSLNYKFRKVNTFQAVVNHKVIYFKYLEEDNIRGLPTDILWTMDHHDWEIMDRYYRGQFRETNSLCNYLLENHKHILL